MSKTEELASQSERVADSRLEDDAYEWSVEADVQLRMCAAELRRLAQVERELEALKASIGEPVAIIGRDYQILWARQDWSECLYVGAHLYVIKEVK